MTTTPLTREPAAYVGVVEAALVFALSFNQFHLSPERIGLIMGVVTIVAGCLVAWRTVDTWLGAAIGIIKAIIALAAGYGFNLTSNQAAAVIGFATVALALFNRTQTSPVAPLNPAAGLEH